MSECDSKHWLWKFNIKESQTCISWYHWSKQINFILVIGSKKVETWIKWRKIIEQWNMLPAKSGTSGSCPWSSSFLTWSWSPRMAATCRGVSPRSLRCCLVRFLSSAGVGAAEHEIGGKSDQPARNLKTLWFCTASNLEGRLVMRSASLEPVAAAPTWALWLGPEARRPARARSPSTATSMACFGHSHEPEGITNYSSLRSWTHLNNISESLTRQYQSRCETTITLLMAPVVRLPHLKYH